MRKKFMNVALLCIMLLSLVLTGCGQSSGQQQADNLSNETNQSEVSDDGAEESSGQTSPQPSEDVEIDEDTSVVYMTSDLSASGLVEIYGALGASPSGNIAVKLSQANPEVIICGQI